MGRSAWMASTRLARAGKACLLYTSNIDMYSGFVYSLLDIPEDLFTPLFACARMSGWAAHRFEEIVSGKRIIRPAYKSTRSGKRPYVSIENR